MSSGGEFGPWQWGAIIVTAICALWDAWLHPERYQESSQRRRKGGR